MARCPPAEAGSAVFPGLAGDLHRSDPHLRLQAPPVRRADRLHTGSPDCLLGGQYTLTCLFLCISARPHVRVCFCLKLGMCLCPFCFSLSRPSTSHQCLKVVVQICLRPRPRTAPYHPTTPSAKPHIRHVPTTATRCLKSDTD